MVTLQVCIQHLRHVFFCRMTHLNEMTSRRTGYSSQTTCRICQCSLLRSSILMIMARCDRPDPARVAGDHSVRLMFRNHRQGNLRIDDGAAYRSTLDETKVPGSVSRQAVADRLTSCQNQTVLARCSADLIIVALY
jgi:hypothetical protein